MSYIGDHVWLITSRQTLPDLRGHNCQFSFVEIVLAKMTRLISIVVAVVVTRNEGRYVQLVDVGVEYAVHKTNARALVGILIGQFDMYLPQSTLEGS